MRKVTIDEVDNEISPLGVHSVRRPVSRVLGCEHVAMNYFELQPGESFSGGLHTHRDQEEVFYVQSGEATFEFADVPDTDAVDTVTVGAGEVVRFGPGEFQEGFNAADRDEPVVGFAIGAPGPVHDWDAIESVVFCRECDAETAHGLDLTDDGRFEFTCLDCDASWTV